MKTLLVALSLATLAAGQVVDGISTSVSRTVSIAPDEAVFRISLQTTLDVTQAQAAEALGELGFSGAVLAAAGAATENVSFNPMPRPTPSLAVYEFAATVSPERLREMAGKLDQFAAALPEGFRAVQYASFLSASSRALEQAHQRLLPDLLAEARRKAEQLANAAGVRLGALEAVSENTTGLATLMVGRVSSTLLSSVLPEQGGIRPTFVLTVKYAKQGTGTAAGR